MQSSWREELQACWETLRLLTVSLIRMVVHGLGYRWWLRFFMFQGLFLSATWWICRPHDDWLLKRVLHTPGIQHYETLSEVARVISRVGDYGVFTLGMTLLLLSLGWLKRNPQLMRLGLACFLSASLAGASALTLRSLLGRSRPYTKLEDNFYGPQSGAAMRAFPSGHTATAVGTAVPLAIACPPVGVPALVLAGATAWSRLHLRQHRPTDLAGGIWEALWFGIPLGLAARRLRELTA